MKEKALFYLNRLIKDLENRGASFDMEEAAHKGMSYKDRQTALEMVENLKDEYEAMLWVKEYLMSSGANEGMREWGF